nr:MAG TPA: hypothetical protein [Bacteriophage sp.]
MNFWHSHGIMSVDNYKTQDTVKELAGGWLWWIFIAVFQTGRGEGSRVCGRS